MPEDELRACTVEIKLSHEAKLKALLKTVRSVGVCVAVKLQYSRIKRLQLKTENDAQAALVAADLAAVEELAEEVSQLEAVVAEVVVAAGASEAQLSGRRGSATASSDR